MEKKLEFGQLLSNTFTIGLKNLPSLIGCVVLWAVTLWIPYINVGTTIAIATIPAALSKGKVISPLEIFDKKYFRYMGEFFLVTGLRSLILVPAAMFLIVPAIVLGIAYSLSTLLVVDKGKGAADALKLSNKLTYGNKLTIFLAQLVLGIGIVVILFILSKIWSVLALIGAILVYPILLGFKANIYGQLALDVQEEE